jgi:hypothetical protein
LVGQNFEDPFPKHPAIATGVATENFEDEFVFPKGAGVVDLEMVGKFVELVDVHELEFAEMKFFSGGNRDRFAVFVHGHIAMAFMGSAVVFEFTVVGWQAIVWPASAAATAETSAEASVAITKTSVAATCSTTSTAAIAAAVAGTGRFVAG